MSDNEMSDPFETLKDVTTPSPHAQAKDQALAAGRAAFAGAQQQSASASKGKRQG
ncbi:MAG: hypothetical protein MO846_09790 [Candidatus Devosia symbiotica]|nr:hypothetical protein [Candidatus Devosia symbiotica]